MSALSAVLSSDAELDRWNSALHAPNATPPVHQSPRSQVALQVVAPPLPKQDAATVQSASLGTNPNMSMGTGERVPSRRDARALINMAFVNALPRHRFPAKEIAAEIGAAENTVEGWRAPDGVMSAEFLMILQVRYSHFEAEIRRLFRLQRELNPAFQKELADFLRRVL